MPDARETEKWTVHIEVCLARASARLENIENAVRTYINNSFELIALPSVLEGWQNVPLLKASVGRITVAECAAPSSTLPVEEVDLDIHLYNLLDNDSFEEFSSTGDGEQVMAANVCELPNRSWDGLWNSLIYADDIKTKLLDYIHTTFFLSDANVDFNLVSWNRVVLLHGPPGTGKTSLCRALSQKLAIRLSSRYPNARLLEINSHSLFSRWFSESGKLVQRLFDNINETADDGDAFLVVLIDEVESLTAARAGAIAGTEPSDGLRVVNALLTQLDKLKHKKNVLVMTTSNLPKAIDCAFVDRADIVRFVDLPPREAIYEILSSSLCELMLKGIISSVIVPNLKEAQRIERLTGDVDFSNYPPPSDEPQRSKYVGLRLMGLATECRKQKLSGRALRRLPVLALSEYIGIKQFVRVAPASSKPNDSEPVSKLGAKIVEIWLDGMEKVLKNNLTQQVNMA